MELTFTASQLRTGLVDRSPIFRCGGKWECSPSYDLSRVNSSALEPPSPADAADFEARRRAAAASCEAAQARVVGHAVVQSGGWCLNMSGALELSLPRGGSYLLPRFHTQADLGVLMAVIALSRPLANPPTAFPGSGAPASINDIGAGVGQLGRELLSRVPQARYAGFDGAPNVETVTQGFVRWMDLTLPLHFDRADWVVSLEVGEHIRPNFEGVVIRNLHAHNCRGIILSWAKRVQFGLGHVNNHDPSTLEAKFRALGYYVHSDLTNAISNPTAKGDIQQWKEWQHLHHTLNRSMGVNLGLPRGFVRRTVRVYVRHQPVEGPGCAAR